jgi:hypothetical protein
MRERVLIDNDVLLKIAAWRLEGTLLATMSTPAGTPAMLGVARHVVGRRLARRGLANAHSAIEAFRRLCGAMAMLEPEPDEIVMAAGFEEAATRAGLELDAGESQLLAMLVAREARLLLTGDKRAIVAIAGLGVVAAQARVAALDQLARIWAERIGVDALRSTICAERVADTALAICFACHREECPAAEITAGLDSYCRDIERAAGAILIGTDELRTLAA